MCVEFTDCKCAALVYGNCCTLQLAFVIDGSCIVVEYAVAALGPAEKYFDHW